jgi:hypothetical protein
METALDILKYCLPAAIVGGVTYMVLRQIAAQRSAEFAAAQRSEALKTTLPLRLQAYERLTLLCDRTQLTNALLRVRMPGMNVRELQAALLIAINHEFDHNVSQQLYVSDTLWQIISVARRETLASITLAAQDLDPNEDAEALVSRLLAQLDAQPLSALDQAIMAIRTEASRLF